ncbi:MAG: hypothetical protein AB1467_02980 [Candidatus Diapherotrites archaeon]
MAEKEFYFAVLALGLTFLLALGISSAAAALNNSSTPNNSSEGNNKNSAMMNSNSMPKACGQAMQQEGLSEMHEECEEMMDSGECPMHNSMMNGTMNSMMNGHMKGMMG